MLLLALTMVAGSPELDRMVTCQALHEQWQWDLRNAQQPVYHDSEWFIPFHQKLLAAAEAEHVDRDDLARRNNTLVDSYHRKLTPEQTEDWGKCQAEFGWHKNADGSTFDF